MNGIPLMSVPPQDPDAATDEAIFRNNATWSKGRLKRAMTISAILGSKDDGMNRLRT